ncbi:MAG: peptidylprolyl isomerase [Flavobacterium sp.]
MKFHLPVAITLFLIICSCKNENKDTHDNKIEQKNEIISISNEKDKRFDIEKTKLTNENIIPFLKWYGEKNQEKKVLFETRLGDIEILLFDETPLHRANFIYLTKRGYFNTTYFHRVVKNFIIQGGNSDEKATGKFKKNIGKYLIPAEFNKSLKHHHGALAAARSWDDNPEKLSNPFEFYIIQNKNGSHHLDGEHTVFGKVVKGFDVVDLIGSQEIDAGEFPLLNIQMKVSVIK